MDNNSIWKTGTPEKSGVYVVAILYENGLGTIITQSYSPNNGGWRTDENIIAYIPLNDLLEAAKVEWPEELTPPDMFSPPEK